MIVVNSVVLELVELSVAEPSELVTWLTVVETGIKVVIV